ILVLVIYLVARAWGTLLPYLAQLAIAAGLDSGRQTALLYLFNIIGAAAGSIVTGFVLMEFLSLPVIVAITTSIGLLTGAVVFLLFPFEIGKSWRLTAAVVALPPFIYLSTFLAGNVLQSLHWGRSPLVSIIENRSGIIAVDGDGIVYGNGMYDG